jgi:acyl-homoserine lactone synthase
MFKVRVVRWKDRKENKLLLEQYFRLRHEIYIDDRGWRDVERPIGMEIDAFDDRHAVYLIGLDDSNNIRGASRLVPTLGPHLLADVFPELARYKPPRDENIFEWTRFFVHPDLRTHGSGRPSQAAALILCAMLEFGLRANLRAISVVCETFWPDRFRKLGWNVEQLGPVLHHADGDIVALLITLSADMLQRTRTAYGLPLDQSNLDG